MSSQKKYSNRYLMRRSLLTLLGVFGVLGAATSAEANVETARQTLEARVHTMRAAIHDAAKADSAAEPSQKLAWWANNWGDWGNWNNWNNAGWANWLNQ